MAAVDPRAAGLTSSALSPAGLAALTGAGGLVLASASPRRADLLRAAGVPRFEVRPSDVDESALPGESAERLCERLARLKACAVAGSVTAGTVLGGDTVVVRDEDVLGKPRDRDDARVMLASLGGREHEVLSAVALVRVADGVTLSGVSRSRVRFSALDGPTLDAYLEGDEWRGKAGAYAIQGDASAFAELVSGDHDTVVGLPVTLVDDLARQLASIPLDGTHR